MKNFSVTYGIITPESCEQGDYDSSGFACKNVDLREAFKEVGYQVIEANSSPISLVNPPQWLTNYEYGHGTRDYYEKGIEETRSLHFPDTITPSSAMRIARLFGLMPMQQQQPQHQCSKCGTDPAIPVPDDVLKWYRPQPHLMPSYLCNGCTRDLREFRAFFVHVPLT